MVDVSSCMNIAKNEMSGRRIHHHHLHHVSNVQCLSLILILALSSSRCVWCADSNQFPPLPNIPGNPLAPPLMHNHFNNLSKVLDKDITRQLGFCIKDVEAEFSAAFNYSNNLNFLNNCVIQNKDAMLRLCTAAEMIFYFSSFKENEVDSQVLRPNRNCNLTSWVPGCEPGWASSVSEDEKLDLNNAKTIPDRTRSPRPCCEGFFCPRGLTCMIPCPLGAYCPMSKLNESTGICDPYVYQLPTGISNHSCGGADSWAYISTSEQIFCPAGNFCPTTTTRKPCTKGHFCRMGSTKESDCSFLSSCNPKSENQNLHAYGILLISVLSFILIIIYNCSDQVLTTRYKRLAKSREKAARSARETARARARWKIARNVAQNKTVGLSQQLSRTFSRKKSVRDSEEAPLPPKAPAPAPPPPAPPPVALLPLPPKSRKPEPSHLTQMLQSIEDNPESQEGFHFQIGDKNIKKQKMKAKELHTRSQIFRYAYGELEKEKAMDQKRQDLTFSGVISMATDTDNEIKKRPTLEVTFKDLTITLKGKHSKHLMRSVSGKLFPGRISAVMGPSGAGKTTFLSAVMGKIKGCEVTGSVLVNGNPEPIQSYQKIIGFVPQDDIVHGNLTVEENLRFSAGCRLDADMLKADKVLVVERVIESLGLQGVRESLVGTVEKRGISGGQRKRVNVGLEMVMEPSLLILDEPTSGLDSASSYLLIKALRREALEGVNICMVVHQPSYSLYKMFHDLILLAKGGLVVYHGPVTKVEEYFSGIGITVPERVNPPDHLIDILEGITKLNTGVTVQQLPVRWMLYNGYPVPHDMLEHMDGLGSVPNPNKTPPGPESWDKKHEHMSHKFLKYDLSNRVTPNILRQYRYFLGRVGKQRLREAKVQAVDYLILLLAGACLGILADTKGDTFLSASYMYTIIAVSLLSKIAALRSFSLDKLHYMRESDSGMSSLASFLSKDTIDHFNTIVTPLVFLSMYFFFSNPRSSFLDNYIVLLCLVYCVTGIAYIFAICFEPGPAQLWCVLLPVVLSLITSQDPNNKVWKIVMDLCYPKWTLEAFVIKNAERYSGVWLITRCHALTVFDYNVHHFVYCLLFLVCTGILSRLIAFICLVAFGNK